MRIHCGEIGKTYEITEILCPEHVARRLESLGMVEGAKITVLNKKKKGAVMVKVRGTRWALGLPIAKEIEGKEVEP